jgi:uncharacterized protein (TIGR03437 family)
MNFRFLRAFPAVTPAHLTTFVLLLFVVCPCGRAAQNYLISTLAGGNVMPATPIAGTSSSIQFGNGIAVDSSGNVYLPSGNSNALFKLDTHGVLTRIAGTGAAGFSGDNGPALNAQMNSPFAVAVDTAGNLYVADTGNSRIRKIAVGGTITTVAGNGTAGRSGDGGPATSAELHYPYGVAVDSAGNLFIPDTYNNSVRKVDNSGTIFTVAGSGSQGYSGDGGAATSAQLWYPSAVAADSAGNLYIADTGNNRIRKVSSGLTIATVAGTGVHGYSGDGGAATSAQLYEPYGIAVDAAGNLYIADTENYRIRKVNSSGTIATVAGTGTEGYSGDGGAAAIAQLYLPFGVVVDSTGNLYILDDNSYVVRTISAGGIIATVAGGGARGAGDGGPCTLGQLSDPYGVARDSAGNTYIADEADNRVRRIAPNGVISTVAGTGVKGYSGDNGAASSAQLNYPAAVTADTAGNLYIADTGNHRIRKVSASGIITTIAGNGSGGYSGDGAAATGAQLYYPEGVALDAAGNLYIADNHNHRIRQVNPSGTISTVAGTGSQGYAGDGGAATSAKLNEPIGLWVDAAGNLYIADTGNGRIRRVDPSGKIATVAGGGTSSPRDGSAATAVSLLGPYGVSMDAAGNLYIGEASANRVRVVSPSGIIATIAGNGSSGYSGDGGPAGSAALWYPTSVFADPSGAVYVADSNNMAVRLLSLAGAQSLLTIQSSHSGDFTQGQTGATYTLTVANAMSAGATSGMVTVTELLPAGLTLVSMAGSGWSCTASTCTRSDTLVAGSSYPVIAVTVNVSAAAPGQMTNQAAVSGGGPSAGQATEDVTNIAAVANPLQITGVSNAASGQAVVAPNTWISIYGTNFAAAGFSDTWSNSIVKGSLPTALDGVKVTVGGNPAYVAYVGAGQINVLTPAVASGSASVTVTTASGASAPVTVAAQQFSPAFFLWPNAQPVATHANYSWAVKNGTFAGTATVPAKPGETIILWGTGFGATNPATPAGVEAPSTAVYYTANPVSVTIGGVPATGVVAVLAPGFGGLYEVVVTVPAALANGDYAVVATVGGVSTAATTILTVQN